MSCQAVLRPSEELETGYVGGWWLSLGIKSPFTEFTTEVETLSNDTTYFNFSHHLNVIQSKPLSTSTTTTTRMPTTTSAIPKRLTINIGGQTADFLALFGHHPTLIPTSSMKPIVGKHDKDVVITEHHERAEALISEQKKYVIPLALKTTSNEKEKKSTVYQDTSLHIDELKNHIMMLQNFAQSDNSFQSKFVVFPHLDKNATTSASSETPKITTTESTFTRKRVRINSARITSTMSPQVFLQNDQTPADDPEVGNKKKSHGRPIKQMRREKNRNKKNSEIQRNRFIDKNVREDSKRNLSRNRRASFKLRKKSVNSIEPESRVSSSSLDPKLCYIPDILSYGQQKICVTNVDVMPVVSRAARAALQNCQQQFKKRRWDCHTTNDATVFGPVISIGSPEMAFIHALSSASLMSFVARACRDGAFNTCGCSKSKKPHNLREDWVWGGCGDDFEFAYKFSQRFVDSREKELRRLTRAIVSAPPREVSKLLEHEMNTTTETTIDFSSVGNVSTLEEHYTHKKPDRLKPKKNYRYNTQLEARSLMNLHNNEAGRRAVVKKSRINCKCHGVSGSCSIITCWQQLTSIKDIAEYLKEKYDAATQVKLNQRKKLQVRDYRRTVPVAEDLVYLDSSPDWCRPKGDWWKGTQGRPCNRNSKGPDSCLGNNMCCGRGFNTRKIVVREKCNCKFHWCCTVKCKTCVKTIEEYTCK